MWPSHKYLHLQVNDRDQASKHAVTVCWFSKIRGPDIDSSTVGVSLRSHPGNGLPIYGNPHFVHSTERLAMQRLGKQGPKRPHKHKDPTNDDFWYPLYWVLEPKCAILMFMWSLGPQQGLASVAAPPCQVEQAQQLLEQLRRMRTLNSPLLSQACLLHIFLYVNMCILYGAFCITY